MCVVRSDLLTTFDSCVAEMIVARPHTSGLEVARSTIAGHKERALETAMKVHAVLMEHIIVCPKWGIGQPTSHREKYSGRVFPRPSFVFLSLYCFPFSKGSKAGATW